MNRKKRLEKSAKQQEIERPRMKVATLILSGRKQRDITKHLGVSPATVHSDLKALLLEWRQSQLKNVAAIMTLELARIDAAINAIWPKVTEGSLFGIDRLISLIRLRSKIMGYAEQTPDISVVNQPVQVIEVVKEY